MDNTYNIIPQLIADELPGDTIYKIKTHPDLEDCFGLPVSEYRALRKDLINKILSFYHRIDYKDGGLLEPYLTVLGYKEQQLCLFVFYIPEWYQYRLEGSFDIHIEQYLNWGIINYREDNRLPTTIRLKQVHPITKNTVLRSL